MDICSFVFFAFTQIKLSCWSFGRLRNCENSEAKVVPVNPDILGKWP